MKDIKDKSEDLKTRGREILSLRQEVKQMQQESQRLLADMREEEIIEQMTGEREREKPVQQMSVNELKTRLLKVAQAYKA